MMHESEKQMAPFVRQAAREVDALFPRRGWTSTYPRHGENSAAGAFAVDFMVNDKPTGDKIAAYVWRHRKRMDARYVIWHDRIISMTNLPSQWRRYINPDPARRNTASGRHTNHVHVSFFPNGRYIAPRVPPVPVPVPVAAYPVPPVPWTVYLDRLREGVTDSDSVAVLQVELGLPVTGAFTARETAAVKRAQAAIDGTTRWADGKLGPLQAAELFGPGVTIELEA